MRAGTRVSAGPIGGKSRSGLARSCSVAAFESNSAVEGESDLVMIHANGGNRGVSNVNGVGKLFALLALTICTVANSARWLGTDLRPGDGFYPEGWALEPREGR